MKSLHNCQSDSCAFASVNSIWNCDSKTKYPTKTAAWTFMCMLCMFHTLAMYMHKYIGSYVVQTTQALRWEPVEEKETARVLTEWLTAKVFAVCIRLLILSAYGHVSGWRSRILLQRDWDGPIQSKTEGRKTKQNRKGAVNTKHLRSRVHTLSQVHVEDGMWLEN